MPNRVALAGWLVVGLGGCTGNVVTHGTTSTTGSTTAGSTTAGGTTAGGTTVGGTTVGGTTAGGTTAGLDGGSGCAHDVCTAGVALSTSCDACATAVCAQDSFCCTNSWNARCVTEVATYCSSGCSGSTTGTTGTTGGADMGTAARNPSCTPSSQWTGKIINTSHGRLDGTLVYVLPVNGSGQCDGDNAHVHLQVQASGNVYDVAVDIGSTGDDVGMYQTTVTVPGGVWSEGWHNQSLSYSSLSLSSSSFPLQDPATIASELESLLNSTSKISIFCTGYTPGDNGCHDVHYENGSSTDGAIVLNPTSASSSMLFFRFSGDNF